MFRKIGLTIIMIGEMVKLFDYKINGFGLEFQTNGLKQYKLYRNVYYLQKSNMNLDFRMC